jgi:hypothetical protein
VYVNGAHIPITDISATNINDWIKSMITLGTPVEKTEYGYSIQLNDDEKLIIPLLYMKAAGKCVHVPLLAYAYDSDKGIRSKVLDVLTEANDILGEIVGYNVAHSEENILEYSKKFVKGFFDVDTYEYGHDDNLNDIESNSIYQVYMTRGYNFRQFTDRLLESFDDLERVREVEELWVSRKHKVSIANFSAEWESPCYRMSRLEMGDDPKNMLGDDIIIPPIVLKESPDWHVLVMLVKKSADIPKHLIEDMALVGEVPEKNWSTELLKVLPVRAMHTD